MRPVLARRRQKKFEHLIEEMMIDLRRARRAVSVSPYDFNGLLAAQTYMSYLTRYLSQPAEPRTRQNPVRRVCIGYREGE
jgi:hypothetical protein